MSLRQGTVETAAAERQLEELLVPAFHVPAGRSFYDDFPVWNVAHGARIHRAGFFAGETLVASAGARLAEYEAPGGGLLVSVIGGVVTAPEWRGKGLATQATQAALAWSQAQGAALAVLWGSEHQLYGRLGFGLCGEQLRAPVVSLVPRGDAARERGLRFGEGWRAELWQLLLRRGSGFRFSEADMTWVQAHRNVRWRWAEREGRVIAYAAAGRGIDLAGIVHEWGGEAGGLRSLLGWMAVEEPELQLIGPRERLEHYGLSIGAAEAERLCLAKVLDPQAVLAAFERQEESSTLLRLPEEQRAPYLFGGAQLASSRPAQLWFWGLDAA